MSKKAMIFLSLAIVGVGLSIIGWKLTARSSYESAQYTVIESNGDFEIREYPDLMIAATEMRVGSQGDGGSFRRLFRYIDGANADEQKIAMTIPVFMNHRSKSDLGDMEFVLPRTMPEERIPKPIGENVQIRKRVGGRFAVIRFSGRMDKQSVADAEAKLREWMKTRGLNGNGRAEFAGYDPPWTPGPFRRNEVLVRLK